MWDAGGVLTRISIRGRNGMINYLGGWLKSKYFGLFEQRNQLSTVFLLTVM